MDVKWTKPSSRLPEEMYQPWAGIFSVERRIEMPLTEEKLKLVLLAPEGFTSCSAEPNGRIHNRILIYRMLQQLYEHVTIRDNFLKKLAVNSRPYRRLTEKQAWHAARLMRNYIQELLMLGRQNQEAKLAPPSLKPVSNEVEHKILPKGHPLAHSSYEDDDDNILEV